MDTATVDNWVSENYEDLRSLARRVVDNWDYVDPDDLLNETLMLLYSDSPTTQRPVYQTVINLKKFVGVMMRVVYRRLCRDQKRFGSTSKLLVEMSDNKLSTTSVPATQMLNYSALQALDKLGRMEAFILKAIVLDGLTYVEICKILNDTCGTSYYPSSLVPVVQSLRKRLMEEFDLKLSDSLVDMPAVRSSLLLPSPEDG